MNAQLMDLAREVAALNDEDVQISVGPGMSQWLTHVRCDARRAIALAVPLEPVESSNIQAIGHDGIAALVVQFKGGARYLYLGVDRRTMDAFRESPSKGAHFAANIKAKFEAVKIEAA